MIKKLLLGAAIVVGLIYGSGNDFDSLRYGLTSSTTDNARNMTGNGGGWSV